MNGGYVMIDAAGVDLTAAEAKTVSGLFAKCEDAFKTGKPVFAYNVSWGSGSNKKLSPLPIFLQKWSSTLFVATCSILKVDITNEDSVTVTNLTT